MNNEIEVGEFVRTKDGYIGKVGKINYDDREKTNYYICEKDNVMASGYLENIKTHSKNKIDIVECGDYVNGWKVLAKTKIKNNEMQVCILTGFEDEHWITINNETLKTILTKESFKEREYVF